MRGLNREELDSWPQRSKKERREILTSPRDELLDALLIHAEHRRDHRPRREWKDAQRHQVDDELLGRDRAPSAALDARIDLLAQHRDDLRPHVFRRPAGDAGDELTRALGMVRDL